MKNSFLKQKLTAFAAALLGCSVLCIHSSARAQPCNLHCGWITIDTTHGMNLECPCTPEDTCDGQVCTPGSYFEITLDTNATCYVDSITITPPSGVCWQTCLAIPNPAPPPPVLPIIYWEIGSFGTATVCSAGSGNLIAGGSSSNLTFNNPTLYGNMCNTNGGLFHGFIFTIYYGDGSICGINL
jgi:hypothetical protein